MKGQDAFEFAKSGGAGRFTVDSESQFRVVGKCKSGSGALPDVQR